MPMTANAGEQVAVGTMGNVSVIEPSGLQQATAAQSECCHIMLTAKLAAGRCMCLRTWTRNCHAES